MVKGLRAIFFLACLPVSVNAAVVWSPTFSIEQVAINGQGADIKANGSEASGCDDRVFRLYVGRGGQTEASVANTIAAISRAEQLQLTAYLGGASVYGAEIYAVKYNNDNPGCYVKKMEIGPIYNQLW